jgi:hypothetical protein
MNFKLLVASCQSNGSTTNNYTLLLIIIVPEIGDCSLLSLGRKDCLAQLRLTREAVGRTQYFYGGSTLEKYDRLVQSRWIGISDRVFTP